MTNKEKQLLKTIALYFSDGGRDGDFYPEWVEDWTEEELKQFEQEYNVYNNSEDDDDNDILLLPIPCVLSFLLSKL